MLKKLLILGIIALPINISRADCPSYWTAAYKALEGCDGSSTVSAPVYTGPTPEQIQQQNDQADQADLNEDAQDNDDKGIKAYKNGDWNTALNYFRKAHNENPDDPDIQDNLDRARQKVNAANDAARQLQAIASVHPTDSTAAQVGFDTASKPAGDITTNNIATPQANSASLDPVVPESRRTPEITSFEEKRTAFRDRIKKLDETLKTIDATKDPVQVAKIKQEKTNLDDQVHFLNFSIGAILAKPEDDKTTPSVPKT